MQALEGALDVLRQQLAEVEAALEAKSHEAAAQRGAAEEAASRAEAAESRVSELESETERLAGQAAEMQVQTPSTLQARGRWRELDQLDCRRHTSFFMTIY